MRSDGFIPRWLWKNVGRGESNSFERDSYAERIRRISLEDVRQDIKRRAEAVLKDIPSDVNTYDFRVIFDMDGAIIDRSYIGKSDRHVIDGPVRVGLMLKWEVAWNRRLLHKVSARLNKYVISEESCLNIVRVRIPFQKYYGGVNEREVPLSEDATRRAHFILE